jgi:hypothetical protein
MRPRQPRRFTSPIVSLEEDFPWDHLISETVLSLLAFSPRWISLCHGHATLPNPPRVDRSTSLSGSVSCSMTTCSCRNISLEDTTSCETLQSLEPHPAGPPLSMHTEPRLAKTLASRMIGLEELMLTDKATRLAISSRVAYVRELFRLPSL